MIGEYISKKCPGCGGIMITINETPTFDETVKMCKCVDCGYTTNCDGV